MVGSTLLRQCKLDFWSKLKCYADTEDVPKLVNVSPLFSVREDNWWDLATRVTKLVYSILMSSPQV